MPECLTAHPYRFCRLGYQHLLLLRGWFDQPHVRQWYGGPASLEDIADHIEEMDVEGFLVLHRNLPIAYLQSYFIDGAHPYAADARDGLGLDQFIGPAAYLGRGHGPGFLRAFFCRCRLADVERVYVDPKPSNLRAIAAYQKAGFRPIGRRRSIEEGEVLLMEACLR